MAAMVTKLKSSNLVSVSIGNTGSHALVRLIDEQFIEAESPEILSAYRPSFTSLVEAV